MSNSTRFDRSALPPDQQNLSAWPMVDELALDSAQRLRFQKCWDAVRAYMRGQSSQTIAQRLDISRQEIVRLTKRCLVIHSDGRIWGARALLGHQHQKEYQRTQPVGHKPVRARGGMAGALRQLFDRYPAVKVIVDQAFLKKHDTRTATEPRMSKKAIHKKMLTALRAAGVTASDYPFNARYQGIRAVSNYLQDLYATHTFAAVKANQGSDSTKLLATGRGLNSGVHADAPYRRTEFDGHRIDAVFIIEMPHPMGGTHEVILERIWLLVIIDSHSRAVLGYVICLNPEYNEHDVVECIKRAIKPWTPMKLTIPGLKYRPDSGLPSGVIPRCAWACWQELLYDNAKANLSELVTTNLREVVGCAVNAGPVKTPTRRPLIERFFQTLEENGFHRLPSTTGSCPNDPRRTNPAKQALKYHIRLDQLLELTDVLVADYNATPHTSLGYRSPLEQIEFFANDPNFLIRTLEQDKRDQIGRGVFTMPIRRKVRGDIKKGRRPYVEFEDAIYTSEVLARSPELIGSWLVLHIDTEDLRSVTAFLENGTEFGVLTAQGKWSRTPHSLEMRRAINRLRIRKQLSFTENDDPVGAFLNHLNEQAVVNKRSAKRAASQYAKSTQSIAAAVPPPAPSEAPKIEDSNSPQSSPPQPRPVKKSRIM